MVKWGPAKPHSHPETCWVNIPKNDVVHHPIVEDSLSRVSQSSAMKAHPASQAHWFEWAKPCLMTGGHCVAENLEHAKHAFDVDVHLAIELSTLLESAPSSKDLNAGGKAKQSLPLRGEAHPNQPSNSSHLEHTSLRVSCLRTRAFLKWFGCFVRICHCFLHEIYESNLW